MKILQTFIAALLVILSFQVISSEEAEAPSYKAPPNFLPSCVRSDAGLGVLHLANSCADCRTAVFSWCDDSIQKFNVNGYDTRTIRLCIGTVTLLSDVPCNSIAAEKAKELDQILKTSSCEASNDVGDTCSIECPAGESATCSNTSGASTPSCECR